MLPLPPIWADRPHRREQSTRILSVEDHAKDKRDFRNKMMPLLWRRTLIAQTPVADDEGATHDFKKGSPRLQLYKYPLPVEEGASVSAILARHKSTLFWNTWLTKSRGSMGNIFPPIWKARLWGWEQEKWPLGPRVLCIDLTTSVGPRIRELPYSTK